MNGRIKRDLKYKTREILIEWLKTLLTDEEAAKIDTANYKDLLPQQTHVFLNRQYKLSAFTETWIRKQLKKLMERHPDRPISSFTLDEIKEVSK